MKHEVILDDSFEDELNRYEFDYVNHCLIDVEDVSLILMTYAQIPEIYYSFLGFVTFSIPLNDWENVFAILRFIGNSSTEEANFDLAIKNGDNNINFEVEKKTDDLAENQVLKIRMFVGDISTTLLMKNENLEYLQLASREAAKWLSESEKRG